MEKRNVYGRQVVMRIECGDEGVWRRKSRIVMLKIDERGRSRRRSGEVGRLWWGG
jgi:hypothetical protein